MIRNYLLKFKLKSINKIKPVDTKHPTEYWDYANNFESFISTLTAVTTSQLHLCWFATQIYVTHSTDSLMIDRSRYRLTLQIIRVDPFNFEAELFYLIKSYNLIALCRLTIMCVRCVSLCGTHTSNNATFSQQKKNHSSPIVGQKGVGPYFWFILREKWHF